jgi:hypothetical protein
MPYIGGIFSLAVFALWVYCIVDVISTDEALVRNLPKLIWLLIVIFVPTVGSIVWLLLGRPEKAGFSFGDTRYRAPRRPLGPDDSPDFMSEIDDRVGNLRRWEDDLKRREDELKRREQGD